MDSSSAPTTPTGRWPCCSEDPVLLPLRLRTRQPVRNHLRRGRCREPALPGSESTNSSPGTARTTGNDSERQPIGVPAWTRTNTPKPLPQATWLRACRKLNQRRTVPKRRLGDAISRRRRASRLQSRTRTDCLLRVDPSPPWGRCPGPPQRPPMFPERQRRLRVRYRSPQELTSPRPRHSERSASSLRQRVRPGSRDR